MLQRRRGSPTAKLAPSTSIVSAVLAAREEQRSYLEELGPEERRIEERRIAAERHQSLQRRHRLTHRAAIVSSKSSSTRLDLSSPTRAPALFFRYKQPANPRPRSPQLPARAANADTENSGKEVVFVPMSIRPSSAVKRLAQLQTVSHLRRAADEHASYVSSDKGISHCSFPSAFPVPARESEGLPIYRPAPADMQRMRLRLPSAKFDAGLDPPQRVAERLNYRSKQILPPDFVLSNLIGHTSNDGDVRTLYQLWSDFTSCAT